MEDSRVSSIQFTIDHVRFAKEALPHRRAALEFAVKLCGDRDLAADLVQDTYLKAMRYFDSFEEGTNCRAWLFQILKNSYINQYRRRKFEGTLPSDNEEGSSQHNPFEDVPAVSSVDKDFSTSLGDDVAEALDELPEMYRTIVILSDIEEYQYEEIAQFVQCPVGTIRSRLHRARKMLAERLLPYAQEFGYAA